MLSLKRLELLVGRWSFLTLLLIAQHSFGEGLFGTMAEGNKVKRAKEEPVQEAPAARETLFALRDRLQRIPQKLPAPDTRKLAASALADVNSMVRGWTPASTIPAEYSASLQLPLKLLDVALESNQEGSAFAALQAAADDLHIKAEHWRKSGLGLGELVKVVIHTRNGDREQRNLQVLYMPKVIEAVKGAQPNQFPRVSSPTVHLLPPGRYLMWTREPQSNMIGARTIVNLGDGEKTVERTLPVP